MIIWKGEKYIPESHVNKIEGLQLSYLYYELCITSVHVHIHTLYTAHRNIKSFKKNEILDEFICIKICAETTLFTYLHKLHLSLHI